MWILFFPHTLTHLRINLHIFSHSMYAAQRESLCKHSRCTTQTKEKHVQAANTRGNKKKGLATGLRPQGRGLVVAPGAGL